MKKYKFGIIGLGKCGQIHLQASKNYPNLFECVAIHDIDSKSTNIPFYQSIDEFLKVDMDFVVLAAKSNSRFDLSKKVLESQKHLVTEKPFVSTAGELKQLQKVADYNNKLIYLSLHASFTSTILFLLNKLTFKEDGTYHSELGKLIKVDSLRSDPYTVDGILASTIPEFGCGLDSMPNILSEIYMFTKEPKIISYKSLDKRFFPKYFDIKAEFAGEFLGGEFTGTVDWTSSLNIKKSTLTFENGEIILEHTQQKVFTVENDTEQLLKDFNDIGGRLETEWLRMYQRIYEVFSGVENTNTDLTNLIVRSTELMFKS